MKFCVFLIRQRQKFKNQNDIEKAKKAAGIDYGKWYSDKVVYAYDYFDGTDNIKEAGKRVSWNARYWYCSWKSS